MRYLALFLCILSINCAEKPENKNDTDLMSKAKEIHENVITIDTHDDINVKNFTDSINYTQDLDTQVTLPKMIEGGLDVVFLIVYTGQDTLSPSGYKKAEENAMAKFEAIHRLTKEYAPEQIGLAVSSEEVRELHSSGKKVAMIGVENAYPMGTDLANFEKYYNLGARYISLSHNGHSQFCDSNTGEKDDVWLYNGLSELGEKAVDEMNRLGIMIDLSHVSKESMMQIVQRSKAPVIASHSSARALCDHSRNLDDEQLKALKENGGVVQTVAFSSYLNTGKHEARSEYLQALYNEVADSLGLQWYSRRERYALSEAEQEAYREDAAKIQQVADSLLKERKDVPPGVDVGDLVDHIDYMVDLIGIDHVGISSDFDGGGGIEGWQDASETLNVTVELVKRGYTEEEIEKLWGGNLLRVLDEVSEIAEKL
ncbi:dipeptidase [Zeaxanthinibacter enoshimensis]|uniref:Membrane dipeptidase n=1 Tax=Zeaxanthinibacter enoshimensis TaxID=392009 RepID=A0A4V3D3U7_9FLAO|nr:dipeptidase [Zeaxanthinibacter enoshimensis]TDQ31423.1 membrane dipeptidase [Zeaxanthinibacter enoshimensis]